MFSLEEVEDRIFLLTFNNSYDLAMHFLRFQEFYESPHRSFKGKQFTILDYMEWYAKDREGVFSYPADWSGFNIPSEVFDRVFEMEILDENKYDKFMRAMYDMIRLHIEGKFYIIGATKNNNDIIDHEIAHGMWYMNEDYKKEMQNNIAKMCATDQEVYDYLFNILRKLGYDSDPDIAYDEVQAYLSTGLTEDMESELRKAGVNTDQISEPFRETYDKFVK